MLLLRDPKSNIPLRNRKFMDFSSKEGLLEYMAPQSIYVAKTA